MSRPIRSTMIGVAAATFAVVLLARSTAPLQGEGQPSPPTSAQIAPFVGDWLVTLAVMANEATFAVAVKNDGGKVSATIGADGQPTVNVTDISVVAKSLVLKYMTEAMGTPLPTVLTLTPVKESRTISASAATRGQPTCPASAPAAAAPCRATSRSDA